MRTFSRVTAALLVGAVLTTAGCGTSDQSAAPSQDTHTRAPAGPAGSDDTWAVASGSSVQLGTGSVVDLDGTVGYLFYTSAGVLVNLGPKKNPWAGSSRWVLVNKDGTSEFTLDLGTELAGTDPTQPYLAYVKRTARSDRWKVILVDVRTGKEVQQFPISGTSTWADDNAVPRPRSPATTCT